MSSIEMEQSDLSTKTPSIPIPFNLLRIKTVPYNTSPGGLTFAGVRKGLFSEYMYGILKSWYCKVVRLVGEITIHVGQNTGNNTRMFINLIKSTKIERFLLSVNDKYSFSLRL